MATTDTIKIKAESLISNSVGQRPTYETASLSLRPERAIAKLCEMAHALSGLWLLRIVSFRRALPYANAKRALPLAVQSRRNISVIEKRLKTLLVPEIVDSRLKHRKTETQPATNTQ
jgi:hypothetical protein